MEETWLSLLKSIIVALISSVLAYLTPVYDIVICIGFAFAGNFFWGYIAGIVAQKDSFCLKKAKVSIYEVLVYVSIVACLFTIGEKMNDKNLALHSLIMITWIWIYFYLVNIFKNLTRIFPNSRGLAFIYFIISLEFIKRFPYLKEFTENEKNKQNG